MTVPNEEAFINVKEELAFDKPSKGSCRRSGLRESPVEHQQLYMSNRKQQ